MAKKNVNVNAETQETKNEDVTALSTKTAKFAEGCKKVRGKAGKALKWVGIGVAGVGLAALGYGVGKSAGRHEIEGTGSTVIDTDASVYEDTEE